MQQHEQKKVILDDEINFAEFWTILRRRKTLIIVLCLASVLASMVVSLLLPKYYKSEAMILAIAPESGGLVAALSASPLASALPGSFGGLTTPADRMLVFLNSRTIAEMVIKRFDLVRVFNERNWDPVKGAWKNPDKPPLQEEAVKYLGEKVTSFKKSKEGTIAITVEWRDPKLAADIANYYVVALAGIMKDKSVNTTVQIVDPAVPAEKESRPRIGMNMVSAGMVSFLIGIFLALLLENLANRNKE